MLMAMKKKRDAGVDDDGSVAEGLACVASVSSRGSSKKLG